MALIIRGAFGTRVQIVSAIGLHDESTGGARQIPSQWRLIIADKTDICRSRVREKNKATLINMTASIAVTDTKLQINVGREDFTESED